jgi:serpin B
MSGHLSDALYGSGEGCQVVELAYQGGNAAMDFLLPDEGALGVFENQLDGGKLEAILARLQASSVALRLPKFEFNTSIDLGGSLSGLGMPDAFNPNLADFSGMTGNRDLFISKVLHQSFVAVGEKGTEAAAATSVIMAPTAALRAQVELTLDHPFVFVIRHLATGQILFVGRVLDPTR